MHIHRGLNREQRGYRRRHAQTCMKVPSYTDIQKHTDTWQHRYRGKHADVDTEKYSSTPIGREA
jgi:hypothetical protein